MIEKFLLCFTCDNFGLAAPAASGMEISSEVSNATPKAPAAVNNVTFASLSESSLQAMVKRAFATDAHSQVCSKKI